MASLPSPTQVAGNHYAIYEAYYNQIDPNNQGKIPALDAAKFLKKSKLSDIVLSKIWDLSDPTGKGYLNKQGFFVALKLCALAQCGRGISMDNITSEAQQPKMGDLPKPTQNKIPNSGTGGIDWSVNTTEKAKYDQLFDSLQPTNGFIPGNKVRGVLMESKLPFDLLGKIWDLADLDKDGSLNRHEFMIAMHLVYKALEKHTIPNTLPSELLPSAKRKDSAPPPSNLIMPPSKPSIPPLPAQLVQQPPQPSRPPLPIVPPQPQQQQPYIPASGVITQQPSVNLLNHQPIVPVLPAATIQVQWVVTAEAKAQYDALFQQTDADKDGFVSGFEIKDVFLQSGVPQKLLAHIWGLCDTKQTGKLNNEEFALAMWLINQKMKGIDPPAVLTPEMVPPSLRTKTDQQQQQDGSNTALYTNSEMDLIASEIAELTKEKNTLETDIAQKEADIKIKNGEVKSLQSELDTLAATLKQLENQKGEANKRLNDLKTQKTTIETELCDLIQVVEAEQAVVDKLRNQAEEQEQSLKSQEDELSSKKQELEGLKQEEQRLENLQEESRKMLDNLSIKLQDSQLQISQVKAKVSQLEETQRQMNDAIQICDGAIERSDTSGVPDTSLSIGPDFRDPEITKLTIINMLESPSAVEFQDDNTFSNINGNNTGFGNDDAFQSDAFRSTISPAVDAFGSTDPFGSAFGAPAKPISDGFSDAFGAFDAPVKSDPFDPFGDGSNKIEAKTPAEVAAEKDPFGCDPFAALHAPERPTNPPARPESPSPALPPKKSKQPPPRPAPPRPIQPNRAAPVPPTPSPDPTSFSNNNNNDAFSSGFANFADFDSKFSSTRSNSSGGSGRSPARSPAQPKKQLEQSRYASFEFTEDPFKNYRYDDLFDLADPFEKQETDKANVPGGKVDPFGFETDDLAYETPVGGNVTELFEAKFPDADAFTPDFSSSNSTPSEFQQHPFGTDFSNNNNKLNGNNLDNFFSNDKNWFDNIDNNSNKITNKQNDGLFGKQRKLDNKNNKKDLPTEDQQLAWAAQESLRLENERRKRQQQEEADLEYALEISRKDTLTKDKKKIRNLLSLGKNKTST